MVSAEIKVVVDMLRANPPIRGDDIPSLRRDVAETTVMAPPEDVRDG